MSEIPWVFGFVAMATAGLAVLAWSAVRVGRAVEGLARELERAGRRLGPEQSVLRRELRILQAAQVPEDSEHGVPSP